MAQQHVLGKRALDLLNRIQEIKETLEYCGEDGGLTQDVHRFVRSLEGPLRSQLELNQWSREVEIEELFIFLNLLPEHWRLPDGEFVAFGVAWCNPFEEEAEDPNIFLRVPPANVFPGRDGLLKQVKPALIAKGFEDYHPEPNPYYPVWKYIRLDSFQSPSGFDEDGFVAVVVETFRLLFPCIHAIDQVLQSLAKPAPPSPSQRPLRIVAFVDTETSGIGAACKMTELAVVVAAYDEIGDQVVGVLEEYSWKQPKGLDGVKARSLLDRAEFVVAHNADFDRGVLARELPGTEKCQWLCSLRGIDWKRVAGVGGESLEALLAFEGLTFAQEHEALADAQDLLRLMAIQRGEKTYLARLLSGSPGARTVASN